MSRPMGARVVIGGAASRFLKMPEGPELHLAACYINTLCGGLLFSGQVEKSEVSKNPEVPFASQSFRICASSRGKEVKLSLTPIKGEEERPPKGRAQPCRGAPLEEEPMDIVFRFGMSGCFKLTPANEVPKHAHLRFYTQENPRRALSFIDVRRFGSWQVNGTWQPDRGPCVMLEYEKFRENVMRNLQDKAFDKPICEALLNQKYFNGIGNYLRAEILYRLKIPPFVKARTVLETLGHPEQGSELTLSKKLKLKKENPDLLELCHLVPMEVINLEGKGYGPRETDDYSGFEKWLQCYYVPGMKTLRDSNNRTIWFQGDPGPMAPKGEKKKRKRGSLEKPDTDAAGLKVASPKGKRKSQGSGTRKDSLGTDEPPKKMARKKAQEGTTRKRKASLRDSSTPQAKGKILRLRRGGKTVTVKDSPSSSSTPLAKARRRQLKKEGEPTPFTEDASKVSQLVKGRTNKLKKEEEPAPAIESSSKDSLLERGRTRQLKEQGEPAPVTEDSLKASQLTKGRKGKLKEGEPAPVTVDSSKDSQPLPVTVDASKYSQLAKGSTRKLNKGGEPAPVTEDSSKDSQLEKGMSQKLKEGEPVPATEDSWKDSRLVKGRTRQLKKEPVTVIEDSSKDSQLVKGRKRKHTKAEHAPAKKDSPNDFQPLPVSEDPLKDSQMAKGRKRKLKKGGEPTPVTKDYSKDSQLEKGMSQQLKEEEPVQLTKDSSKNSQLEKVGTHQPLTEYSPGNSALEKGRKLQPSKQKRAGSASGNRRNPSRVKAD